MVAAGSLDQPYLGSNYMRNVRLIARLDVKMQWLIKGAQMEGWRKVGSPAEYAQKYAESGADELLFMDVVASLYERNNLHSILEEVASRVFVPMTVGGGIRSVEDAGELLARGADKVAINTAATSEPHLVSRISDRFGSQATVVSIEAMRQGGDSWLAMTDNGRNHTHRDVIEWAVELEKLGAGEIIITSIQHEGLGQGLDIDLIKKVTDEVSIPVVASGGLGNIEHLSEVIENTQASAVAIAQALHWNKIGFADLREELTKRDCFVRGLC